jgi:hypothetical protein
MKVSVEAADRLAAVAVAVGETRQYIIDALLRSFTDEQLISRVDTQRICDGAARAAWMRAAIRK